MRNLIIICIAFLTFSISSCEKYLDFDQELKDPKIVLNAILDTDSVFNVHLSRSLNILDSGDLTAIGDAQLQVYDNNGLLVETLTHTGNGFYRGNIKPVANQQYRLVASATGYKEISAEDSIPPKVLIKKIDTLGVNSVDNEQQLKLTITFDDTPNLKNFYKIEVITVENVSGYEYSYPLSMQSEDLSLEADKDSCYTELFFNDILFDGSSKQLVIYVSDTRGYDDFIRIKLTSLSESAYLYQKTYQAYQQSNGNPFAQPVQVFNNVSQGFGILGSQQVVIKEVTF